MGKYSEREYRVGEWWLGQRSGSAAYYGIRYNVAKQSNERVCLGTSDLELAKEKLTELHLKTRSANNERPEEASLADVLRRYWEARGSKVRSAKSNGHCINVWLDHWQEANVSALADVKRQEEFHKVIRERGFSPAGIMRVLNVGKAALNRALQRGELRGVPHVLTIPLGQSKPRPSRAATQRPEPVGHVVLQPVMTGHDAPGQVMTAAIESYGGSVASWLAERAAPTSDQRAINLEKLYRDYMSWCREFGFTSSSRDLFERELDRVRALPDLAGKIGKFGSRYFGITLVGESGG